VRIGNTELPLSIIEQVPLNADANPHEPVKIDLVKVTTGPGGVPVLLRNVKSNDGMWQAGARIYITGDWDDAPKS